MFETYASSTREIRPFETDSRKTARAIAGESIVLLKNNGVLPIEKGTAIALYGEGAACTVKGGVGSGEVNARYSVSIREGLENAGYSITTGKWLADYQRLLQENHREYLAKMRKKAGFLNFKVIHELLSEPFKNPEGMEITGEYCSEESDTCLYVLTRQAGEEMDRRPVKGDFLLTDTEVRNITVCRERYEKLILVINIGGYIDLSPLDDMETDAVLFFCQQGSEGGNALADVVSGEVNPSGHLSSSWPMKYGDVPFGDTFSTLNGNVEYDEYREGIYVGYRYYDSFGVKPRYPFGFGLSYTVFEHSASVRFQGTDVTVSFQVKNIGSAAGKEAVQVYVSCPPGKLDKEYQRLAGFYKTGLIAPGDTERGTVSFSVRDLASFDEARNAFILEPGEYIILTGESSRKTKAAAVLTLDCEVVVSEHDAICPLQMPIEELRSAAARPVAGADVPRLPILPAFIETIHYSYEEIPAAESADITKELSKVGPGGLHSLCVGSGVDIALPKHHAFIIPGACGYSTGSFEKKGIPSISFCDGPAGLRLFDESVITGNTVRMTKPVMESFAILPSFIRYVIVRKPKEGKMLYQYATAFPVGMALAQTFNTELAEAYGKAVQTEMEAFGAQMWLAPGMNIHRNPLCGRNYEYYSEDPLLSGSMAAHVARGVQSKPGFGVTMKHFCCNNQEINRMHVSENLSQRALREIYLRNFRIGVTGGNPKAIMTSYNKINGVYAAENHDTVTKVLKNEWGYRGLVMTDWTTDAFLLNSARAMKAGVDLMMPGIGSDHVQMKKSLKSGELSIEVLRKNASHVLKVITESDLYQRKYKDGGKVHGRFS